ncbi:hypothetical protein SDC9_94888 [bioreactor metagenome]|uniref:Magnesium and cobalt efflux protein CorC n=1 Tax=bioreactor metagenome TaxID=1076179 RepID=A0A645A4P3_9ZZZZ
MLFGSFFSKRSVVTQMGSDSWYYVLLFFLILGGGYFAGSEIAYASVNKIRIKNYAEDGDARAKKALYILNNFDKSISTLLVGNNLMHIGAATTATVIATRTWGQGAVAYSTLITTLVVFLVSEMIPKNLAKSRNEDFALAVAESLYVLMKLLTPVVFFFTSISKGVSKLFKKQEEPTVTEDELYDILETIKEEGSLEAGKSKLISSALEFADVTAQDALTARVDVVAIDIDSTCDEILQTIKEEKYSRLPVYEDNIDHIIGILNIRKFLKVYMKQGNHINLRALLDPPYFVPKTTKIDDLLQEMSRRKLHMAIVNDDYGGTLGIMTVEDILEELVGEIWDEDDEVIEEFIPMGGNRYEVDAEFDVDDAFELMRYENYDKDELWHKTMGSWVLEHFDYVPKEGDCFEYRGVTVTVLTIDNKRITKLLVKVNEIDNKE